MCNENIDVTAIILAAGSGKRIGCEKWKLTFKNLTFLQIIVENLINSGVKKIICVAKSNDLPLNNFTDLIINKNPNCGMFSSVYYGIQSYPTSSGYLVCPVDHPLVTKATIKQLLKYFSENSNSVIIPIYKKQSGHPIIIPNWLTKKMDFYDYQGGLRQFIFDNNADIYKVNVSDQFILCNINDVNDVINWGLYDLR